jgi:hypothetical protein
MKAMPVPSGNASTSFRQASSPPAEAPIPTTVKLPALSCGPTAAATRRSERGRSVLPEGGLLLDIGFASQMRNLRANIQGRYHKALTAGVAMPIAKMKEQAFQFAAIGSVLPVFDAVGTASWNFGGRSNLTES